MDDPEITLAEFIDIVRRAGLRLDADDTAMLFGEIAGSCRVVREMTDRIRRRLAAAGDAAEPAHIFARRPSQGEA